MYWKLRSIWKNTYSYNTEIHGAPSNNYVFLRDTLCYKLGSYLRLSQFGVANRIDFMYGIKAQLFNERVDNIVHAGYHK